MVLLNTLRLVLNINVDCETPQSRCFKDVPACVDDIEMHTLLVLFSSSE